MIQVNSKTLTVTELNVPSTDLNMAEFLILPNPILNEEPIVWNVGVIFWEAVLRPALVFW